MNVERLRFIEGRQLEALRRQEHAAEEELRALGAELRAFKRHEEEVERELREHGYLYVRR